MEAAFGVYDKPVPHAKTLFFNFRRNPFEPYPLVGAASASPAAAVPSRVLGDLIQSVEIKSARGVVD